MPKGKTYGFKSMGKIGNDIAFHCEKEKKTNYLFVLRLSLRRFFYGTLLIKWQT